MLKKILIILKYAETPQSSLEISLIVTKSKQFLSFDKLHIELRFMIYRLIIIIFRNRMKSRLGKQFQNENILITINSNNSIFRKRYKEGEVCYYASMDLMSIYISSYILIGRLPPFSIT